MMASACTLQLHAASFPLRIASNVVVEPRTPELRGRWLFNYRCLICNLQKNKKTTYPKFVLRAFSGGDSSNSQVEQDKRSSSSIHGDEQVVSVINNTTEVTTENAYGDSQNPVPRLHPTIGSLPPVALLMKRYPGTNFVIGICVAATLFVIAVRFYVARKSRYSRTGSVADLVRRGQLRSDRRGISRPLKYEDPFNNPLVKVSKSNSTVEMCGKVYRFAPVTLTKEQQDIHQKRRSRAYQWKRPTMFLREGDSIPSDVDPDTVRWIPANHPFATTASDIDEDLAQNNVYQKRGVPFRIQAEHEALQRKLEALQSEQKLNNLFVDPGAAKDFERPSKLQLKSDDEQMEQRPSSSSEVNSKPPKSDRANNPFESSI